MCGIAGKVSSRQAVSPALLERMCAAIEHRGPDSRGAFLEDGVALGIQRLAVIDLATGDQPIFNEDRNVVVVLNGEIYNYRELRVELEARGHTFSTRSDTEVIVHLYEDHGDACVEHLRGMFAFALWDRRQRRLLIGRDRVGKKPLFYAHRNGDLWFGSETKAILEDPEIPREMDADAIDTYLQFRYVPHPKSAFSALRKLPPAHTLTWQAGRLEIRRYWRLSYSPDDDYADEEEMKQRIRDELLEATRLRLRSDVPLGAFLSGGVDSSAVVAAMAQLSTTPVKTFSIGFDVEEFDETAHARQIAQLFSTDHHEFQVEAEALGILPELVWHYGEPFADQAAIPSLYLSELTRRHVTVALNGDGGDESFAGYYHHIAAVRLGRLSRIPSPPLRAAVRVLDRIGTGGDRSFRSRARRIAKTLLLAPHQRYARMMGAGLDPIYTPEFRASLGPDRTCGHLLQDAWLASGATSEIDRVLDVDVQSFLPGQLLVKMDIATMAHSLEVRSPLLDHRFMEMAAGLPGSVKLDRGTTKRIFKDSLRPWLPGEILDRSKAGFAVPISSWLRGPLRNLPRDVLLDPDSVQRGIFQPERVREIVDRHLSGAEDNGETIWKMLQLELWQRTFVDARRTQPVALAI